MVSLATPHDQPVRADIAVLGGGTAGAVVAGRLVGRTSASVVLVEAGPDYGPAGSGRWPRELLDSTTLPTTHDWGYRGPGAAAGRELPFERARVAGGCSSHNGCSQTVGHADDYRAWGLSWTSGSLSGLMERAASRLRVRRDADEELTPFQAAAMEAMVQSGIPRTDDLDDLLGGAGCGPSPVNNPGGIRWNTGFAYLDPVRGEPRLRVLDHALVDRLEFEGSAVRRARVRRGGRLVTVEADRFVLCGGAYGSPEILLRSGVGPAADLRTLGVEVRLDLPGVGRNLHDHPLAELRFAAGEELARRLAAYARVRPVPDEQVIGKALSPGGRAPYDLHLLPWTGADERNGWTCVLPAACLTPRSRGTLRLVSPDPEVRPVIDHAYLSDPAGADLAALRAGVELCRAMAASPALRPLLGEPLDAFSGSPAADDAALRRVAAHYWHPVGTCAIGADPAAGAVVDRRGLVHGADNLWVADASVMPVIPRATTNLPVVALAEHLVGELVDELVGDLAPEPSGRR
ncbi:GMC family oxidoreductase [Nonomuraea roseoviolacea]|uniref:Choline dehydrogenase n=1 Tax=Nonomuraea roseoviolacea subsp. carminata TaxID=160689 RepID=A0ABT1KFN8_9ACTN|nr:GMC family oxidoreductase [Nonomuraea roseoviolacea]MCP2352449.1 choline dehydrogenase [Nonomuraea roseoviolacea subsp. carminata]